MTDKLNDNDRKRIEQEAKEYGKIFRQAFIEGAEYATIYERKYGENFDLREALFNCRYENQKLEAERSELTKEIERLNNVYNEMDTERQFKDVNLEQLHKLLTEAYQHISYNASNNLHYRIKETLNSLKK